MQTEKIFEFHKIQISASLRELKKKKTEIKKLKIRKLFSRRYQLHTTLYYIVPTSNLVILSVYKKKKKVIIKLDYRFCDLYVFCVFLQLSGCK